MAEHKWRRFFSASLLGAVVIGAALASTQFLAGCASEPVSSGLARWNNGDCNAALMSWLDPARDGNPYAQNNMALIHEKGCATAHIPPSYTEAYKWLELAAQNGLPLAVRSMALYQERGLGMPPDVDKAVALYTLAARRGDDAARLALTRLGKAVPAPDLVMQQVQPPQGQGSWSEAIAAALLLNSASKPAQTTLKTSCTSRTVNQQVVTDCN